MIIKKIPTAKNRAKALLRCDYCGKEFIRKSYVDAVRNGRKNHFCSKDCFKLWQVGENNPAYGKTLSKTTRKKIGDAERGSNNPNWKGGRSRHTNGYMYRRVNNHLYALKHGYVLEHRLVMEKAIGRYLRPEEVVHHINGIKDDNRLENLMLFKNAAEHARHHNKLNKIDALVH